ncbi:MAG: Ig-like domain-containing protein [Clostridia bacterium]|nr:Ig-like domain-containing protein [Clostridia bacterium]
MNPNKLILKCASMVLCLVMLLSFAACSTPTVNVKTDDPSSSPEGSLGNPSNLSSVLESIDQPSKGGQSDPTSDPSSNSASAPVSPSGSDESSLPPSESGGESSPVIPPVKVTGVSLDKSELTLLLGGEYALAATVMPEDAENKKVTFSSSNDKVVTVSQEGVVVAVGMGSATVTVKTADGSFSATCKVQVNDLPATAPRYDENGLPNYTPVFEEGVEYVDFNAKNVLHMFTHCLVDYTGQPERDEFYKDCITADEFRSILEEVYKNDYVLIDIDYMYDYAYVGTKLTATVKKTIKVPKGKKPLIISVDNVAYPYGEHGLGRADRLEVRDGQLYAYTKLKDGSDQYSQDNEVFPILEKFIAAHPDFSFSGAKCVVAPSAADGLFGWDTTSDAKNREENVKQARIIANWFIEHGYALACHSYYHGNFQTMTLDKIRKDLDLWNEEAAPIIGKTHVFIYPYGAFTIKGSENSKLMSEYGFAVFCATSMNGINWDNFPLEGNAYNERIILASKLFVTYKDNAVLNKLFDPYKVYDNSVHSVKLYALSLTSNTLTMSVGESKKVDATVKGLFAELQYSSSGEGLAVDGQGNLTATQAGSYTVTVSVKGSSVKATCTVTVE